MPLAAPPRFDAKCPKCGSLERHRLLFLFLRHDETHELLLEPILHFAPEKTLEHYFRNSNVNYQTADLYTPADLRLNLESLDTPDEQYGTVIANHVLEHVDDKKAAKEIYRILKNGGVFIVMVPLIEGWETTYENPEIKTDKDRWLHFGQNDHNKYYGQDFRHRIEQGGLKLISEFIAEGADVAKYGLTRGEKVFLFRKMSPK